ncbi:MAG: hypothetical protein M1281_04660 [Chloroflexi bacterium]|nr:hypothetical protein [Chloroflexota bacterium]
MEPNLTDIAIGPQYPKDNPFTARMRFHQSWYRANVLNVPFGKGPRRNSPSFYGNMLTRENGEQGFNFFTPQLGQRIFSVVKRRLTEKKGAVEPYRLLCNMLSSQPMCFNLFAPLVDKLELATTLLKPFYPDEILKVTQVKIEFAPEPASEYLNDHTAFDAYVEFTAQDGEKGFVGIETKLVEPFTLAEHEHEEYWKWTHAKMSPWNETSIQTLRDVKVNQLWRDHLLGLAIQHHPKSTYKHGHFLVIYHSGDDACSQSINLYRSLLKSCDKSFKAITLNKLISCWQTNAIDLADKSWLLEFSTRYLNLSTSEIDWMTMSNSKGEIYDK